MEEKEKIINEIIERIKVKAPEYELVRNTAMKCNDIAQEAVSFIPVGDHKGPTLYVDDWLKQFEAGKSISEIVDEAIELVENALENAKKFDLNFTKEYIAKNSYIVVCSREKNTDYYMNAVCELIPNTDLLGVVRVHVGDDASFVLKKDMVANLGLTKEECTEYAFSNSLNEIPVVKTMGQIMSELTGLDEDIFAKEMNNGAEMLVVTNVEKHYGATPIMINRYLQKDLYDQIGQYYVLPSSIHECIVVPIKTFGTDFEQLEKMVAEVNATEVEAKDILSNSVYYYDGIKLTMARSQELKPEVESNKMTAHI